MTTELRTRIAAALGRDRVRANIRRAMDGLVIKRRKAFPDERELTWLRNQGAAIRASALAGLPDLLEELERNCSASGIHVHWAEHAAEGNRIVGDILRRHGANLLIKGKSMVSEEMGLNAFLEGQGVEVVETDLGEFIIQHAGETPSHIVAPAVHKDRHEVAALFRSVFPAELAAGPRGRGNRGPDRRGPAPAPREIPGGQGRAFRRQLRRGRNRDPMPGGERGQRAHVHHGPGGAHRGHGDREGGGASGPDPAFVDPADRARATGQPITTYFNMISSPRRPGEKDGPREVHLVLLDNGRSRIHSGPGAPGRLRCIRCAACINHCPVYIRLGGHAYGTVYPGPIGTVIEPQLQGMASQGELASASTLCGACAEVCPVRIPLPKLINRLRYEGRAQRQGPGTSDVLHRGARRKPLEALVWRLWAWLHANPVLYRGATGLAARLRWLQPRRPWGLDPNPYRPASGAQGAAPIGP